MKSLSGKVAIITGAAQGIGATLATQLAGHGANIVVNYRSNAEGAEEVVTSILENGGKAIAVRADVADPDQAEPLIRAAYENFGRLDFLVHNAASYSLHPPEETTLSDFRKIFETNAFALMSLVKSALPLLQEGSRVIAISSIASKRFQAGGTLYSASKAALDAIIRSYAKELGPRGITVNAVAPGTTQTGSNDWLTPEMQKQVAAATPLRRVGTANDIARVVSFLCSEEAGWLNGQVIDADGGFV